jgi:diadenosine tetraphosphate (Ap4A) HIT family hydrolase
MTQAKQLCAFCTLPPDRIVLSNSSGVLVRDAYPVSKGHSLVIPNRHIGSFFELSETERADLLSLLNQAKQALDALHQPDGYNIGINDGAAAGQTVPHLHIHLIPRYKGDLLDPRGGVRWVIPEKAVYW